MPIIVDLIMIGLLVGVILHSIRLAKSLENFKSIHAEITPLMKNHAETLAHCFKQIGELKNASQEIDHIINSRVPAALHIKNDLEFLVGRANELADHLESQISQGRKVQFSAEKTVKEKPVESEIEKIILKAEPKIELKSEINTETKKAKSTTKKDVPLYAKKEETKSDKANGEKTTMESFFLTKTAKKILNRVKEADNADNAA